MCSNQLGRRNITDAQRTYLLGKLYEARKKTVGNSTSVRDKNGQYQNPENREIGSAKPNATSRQIAEEQGVSHSTVEEAGNYAKGLDAAEEVSPGIREKVLSGEVKAPKSAIVQYLHNKSVNTYCIMCKSVV